MSGSKRVGSAHIEFSARTAKVVSGMDAAKKATRDAARQMKSDMAQARMEVQVLSREIGVPLPRAVSTFVAKLPGVSTALSAAFGVTAVAALGVAVFDVGKKLYEFEKAGYQAAGKIAETYEGFNSALRKTGAELDVTNDKLANQIAKLEHKPGDALKLALDEDRKAAASLAEELSHVSSEKKKALEANGISLASSIGHMAMGHVLLDTDEQKKLVLKNIADIKRAAAEGFDLQDKASPADAERVAQENRVKMQNAYRDALARTRVALDAVYATQRRSAELEKKNGGVHQDFSGQTAILEGERDSLKLEQHNLLAGYQEADNEKRLLQDENAKQQADDAKRRAQEAKRAAEEQFQQHMEAAKQRLAAIKQDHELRIGETADFWAEIRDAEVVGSKMYNAANAEVGNARQADMREQSRSRDAYAKSQIAAIKAADEALEKFYKDDEKADAEMADNALQLQVIWQDNAHAMAELGLQHAVATGAMTEFAAAQVRAQMNAQGYTEELERLRAKLVQVQSADYLTDSEKSKQVAELQQRMATLQGVAAKQYEMDQWAIAQQSAFGGIRSAIDEMAAHAADVSGEMRKEFTSLFQSINGDLEAAFDKAGRRGEHHVGRDLKNALGGTLRNTAGSMANFGLQKVESAAFGAFGLGVKADGSKSNPFYTRSADAINALAASNSPITADMIAWSAKVGGGGSMGSGFLNMLGGALIPHATGGPVSAGTGYLVGERGPEPFFPGQSGYMATHSALQAAVGGSGGTTIHVDARGATDPAQAYAQAYRGTMAAHEQMASGAVKAQSEHRARVPSSSRG